MNRPKLVIFDIVGTTIEGHGEVPSAFEAALAEHGISITSERINAVRGASKLQAVFDLLPDGPDRLQLAEDIYASFKRLLAARFARGVRAMPGANECFAWLHKCGVKVALITGRPRPE